MVAKENSSGGTSRPLLKSSAILGGTMLRRSLTAIILSICKTRERIASSRLSSVSMRLSVTYVVRSCHTNRKRQPKPNRKNTHNRYMSASGNIAKRGFLFEIRRASIHTEAIQTSIIESEDVFEMRTPRASRVHWYNTFRKQGPPIVYISEFKVSDKTSSPRNSPNITHCLKKTTQKASRDRGIIMLARDSQNFDRQAINMEMQQVINVN